MSGLKARTYLRSNGKNKSKSAHVKLFPEDAGEDGVYVG
jgi:hypothetical protein